jgi:predicted transcriptional regulator
VLEKLSESSSHRRRDRLHIIADILVTAKSGSVKTQIMYKANLTFVQLNEYLSYLLETNLIVSTEERDRTIYKVTPKATRFLRNYAEIRDLLKTDDERRIQGRIPVYALDGDCYKIRE